MNALAGAFWFIMVIQSGDLAGTYAPIRMSSYEQCRSFGEALATVIEPDHWLACQSEATGLVNAVWWSGWGYGQAIPDR